MATIVTKNSSTASAVPTTSDLVQGELAVNVTDKRIFTENASTQIVELGTNPSTITTATATVTGTLTANGTFASNNAVITGGSINSTPIGATTPSTVRGSTVTATTGFVGGLTGNVTGNLTGNVTGNVVGNLTGNVTGNVTASTGTTTLNNLVVNGTADFTNTKLTNITTPTLDSDAANKGYVDATVAAVIDSAPAALDTLNELAAALGDDANFSATVTTALATKLPLAGGTMTGAIAMGTSKITGLGDPTASQDAATKIYVDTADNLKLNLSGGTMSGAIAMGTNKITGLGDPTLAQDAATKAYTDSILGSATSAAVSAAAAATSESNAATSASNAATSETNALNSANAAASSYDQFDDRYLGDKASDPTLDNDGNALLTGALYFNTTTDVMRVYNGSAWQDTALSPNSPTFTGTVTADGLSLGDNDKATFGAGNDLQIYHDGSGSYIDEQGSGALYIRGSNQLFLQSSTGDNYLVATSGGAVNLRYDGNIKLATTATGINVTGAVTSDDKIFIESGNPYIAINDTDITDLNTMIRTQSGVGYINTINDAYDIVAKRIGIDHATGDISFYEDTGTTPKFFWDASAESLGIGTSSPARRLSVNSAGIQIAAVFESTSTNSARISLVDANTTGDNYVSVASSGNDLALYAGAAEKMRIDSSGTVLIGATSSTNSGNLVIADSVAASIVLTDSGAAADLKTRRFYTANQNLWIQRRNDDGSLKGTDVAIDNNGNVGIGTTAPDNTLHVQGASTTGGPSTGNVALFEGPSGTNGLKIFVDDTANASGLQTISADDLLLNPVGGNVGIGTTSPAGLLSVDLGAANGGPAAAAGLALKGGASSVYTSWLGNTDEGLEIGPISASRGIQFWGGGSEAMRINASGNLLVGKTATSLATIGIEAQADGVLRATADSKQAAIFRRNTTDGNIANFWKDGTTVGSIGADSGKMYLGTNNIGLLFDVADNIQPYHTGNNVTTDGVADIGSAAARFKDLYLSGTANVANVKETVYALTGTALDAGNGGIQTKTLAANTTFTDSLASGESLVLQLEAGASYTVTWPTMQWVTSGGNVAPTLTAKDTLVFWKVSTTLYGAYTGSYV